MALVFKRIEFYEIKLCQLIFKVLETMWNLYRGWFVSSSHVLLTFIAYWVATFNWLVNLWNNEVKFYIEKHCFILIFMTPLMMWRCWKECYKIFIENSLIRFLIRLFSMHKMCQSNLAQKSQTNYKLELRE
jgi:hypothetical protein